MRAHKRLAAAFLTGFGLMRLGLFGVAISHPSGAPALKAAGFTTSGTMVDLSNQGQKIVGT